MNNYKVSTAQTTLRFSGNKIQALKLISISIGDQLSIKFIDVILLRMRNFHISNLDNWTQLTFEGSHPSSLTTATDWAAKASLRSSRSTSLMDQCAFQAVGIHKQKLRRLLCLDTLYTKHNWKPIRPSIF